MSSEKISQVIAHENRIHSPENETLALLEIAYQLAVMNERHAGVPVSARGCVPVEIR